MISLIKYGCVVSLFLLLLIGCYGKRSHIYHTDHEKRIYGGINYSELMHTNDYSFSMFDDIDIDDVLGTPIQGDYVDIAGGIDVRTIILRTNDKDIYLGYNLSDTNGFCEKVIVYNSNIFCDEDIFNRIFNTIETYIIEKGLISKDVVRGMYEIEGLVIKNKMDRKTLKEYIDEIENKASRDLFIAHFKSKGLYP